MNYRFGPETRETGTVFRLWAPAAGSVSVQLYDAELRETQSFPLERIGGGWWLTPPRELPGGTLYHFQIDGELRVPDPASRFQPKDVHGPSMLLGPKATAASPAVSPAAEDWAGLPWERTVLYELHIGTFTPAGTYEGAAERLPHLADLGITAVELMPLSDFPGQRNWGYDGVLPYAPDSSYGTVAQLRSFVDRAHSLGMMVFLDVVYNHFGPEGNYLHVYAPEFFTDRFDTPWGSAIDFSRVEVRRFFIENAIYWLSDLGFDGLRLDAVHAIEDPSETHILDELSREVRRAIDPRRTVHLVLENDANQARYLGERPTTGYEAQWNDDAHHVFHVVATGEDDGYYQDYSESWEDKLMRLLTQGFVYQGEESPYRSGERRGEPSDHLRSTAFVDFLQNHDQVGNRPFGRRLTALVSDMPGGLARIAALQSVLLLSPHIPMLFMGEEWGTEKPFLYFCDYKGDLAQAVTEGRRREFAGFAGFSDPGSREQIPDPNSISTFEKSKLDWGEVETSEGRKQRARCRELLALRRKHVLPLLKAPDPRRPFTGVAAGCPAPGIVLLRWEASTAALTLVANLSERVQLIERDPRYLGTSSSGSVLELFGIEGEQSTRDAGLSLGPWSVSWRLLAVAEGGE